MAKLIYFDGRGLGEICRLCLTAAGIEYEDVFLQEREEFLTLEREGKAPFGTVPILELENCCIFDTRGIIHYAARKGNLLGSTVEDEGLVNCYFEATRDCTTKGRFLAFGGFAEPTAVLKAWKEALEKFLPKFEKRLTENNGWFVGGDLTLADLGYFEICLGAKDYFASILNDYPQSQAFVERLSAMDRIRAYLAKRQPPTRISTPRTVKKVLGWGFDVWDPETGEKVD